jgi:DNA-binding NtrC family response regulator
MEFSFKVLIIEDNIDIQESLKRALSRLGCKVTAVDTSENAFEELKNTTFDAIFAELCLKGESSRSIARWVKTNSPQTKFFVITSWKGLLNLEILNKDGIHAIIHKPLIFSEIRDKLLEFLG